jgi:hypothetical protein
MAIIEVENYDEIPKIDRNSFQDSIDNMITI